VMILPSWSFIDNLAFTKIQVSRPIGPTLAYMLMQPFDVLNAIYILQDCICARLYFYMLFLPARALVAV